MFIALIVITSVSIGILIGTAWETSDSKIKIIQFGLLDNNLETAVDEFSEADISVPHFTTGNIGSETLIVEIGDYDCELCSSFHNTTFNELLKKDIEFGFVDYPTDDLTFVLSHASYCIAEQGEEKYWEFRDIIYKDSSMPMDQIISKLNINARDFDACQDSHKYLQLLTEFTYYAREFNVASLPTFLIFNNDTVYSVEGDATLEVFENFDNAEKFDVTPPECVGDPQFCYLGNVTSIVDGDTLKVDHQSIRLSVVDSPERNEPYFDEATNFLSDICSNRLAMVDIDDGQVGGSFGRLLATVWCLDGDEWVNANSSAINSDYSSVFPRFCDVSEISTTEWGQNDCY